MAADAIADHPFIRTLYGINRVYVHGYHHVRLLSRCTLPAEGPAILVCNHTASIDPFVLQATSPRVIRWMMAKEFFDLPIARYLCGKLGYIPVTRSGRDMASLKAALRTLDAGHVLGVFPEGRIAPSKALMPFQSGVAMMAARTGAPVVPAALDIQRNLTMLRAFIEPQDATVIYGPPVKMSADLGAATTAMEHAVEALQRQAFASKTPRSNA